MKVAGKSVLITGGTGFLGTHVAKQLEDAGARVFPVGHRDYDLRRRDESDRMLRELRPDAVIHLAAVVGGIGANKASPGRFFSENAIMGVELLEDGAISTSVLRRRLSRVFGASKLR